MTLAGEMTSCNLSSNMAAGFRSYVWDPCLIVSQIVAVQCVFYLFLAFWVVLVDVWTGSTLSLRQFFHYEVCLQRLLIHIISLFPNCDLVRISVTVQPFS